MEKLIDRVSGFFRLYWPIVALIAIGVISHWIWFAPNSTLTFRDWLIWPESATRELANSWGSWLSFFDLGTPNIQIYFLPFQATWGLLTNHGFTFDQAAKVTFLIPIVLLGFLSPYFLVLNQFKDKTTAFTCAIFYGTTTYFLLRQSAHIPIAFVVSLAPLLFLAYLKAIRGGSVLGAVLLGLLVSLGIAYELRVMLIIAFMIITHYVIVERKSKSQLKSFGAFFITAALLNAYWILPLILGGGGSDISGVANRGLFGNGLFNLIHATALHESSWSGGYPNQEFKVIQVQWYLWLIPFIALLSLPNLKKITRQHIFFVGLLFVGLALTKQSASPFGSLYQLLYSKLPGFNLYREASKFYLVTAISYLFLLAYSLDWLSTKSRIGYLLTSGAILAVGLINLYPLMTGSYGTLFTGRHIPSDYSAINQAINKQPEFFRTLWVPTSSRWGTFSTRHPRMSLVNMAQGNWGGFDLGRNPSVIPQTIVTPLVGVNADSLLDAASVKYVIVPLRDTANDDDFFIDYGNDRQYYIHTLDQLPYLKKVDLGAKDVVVYENTGYKDKFYTSPADQQITYQFVSPAKYNLELLADKDETLVMSEAYNPRWKLLVGGKEIKAMSTKDGLTSFTLSKALNLTGKQSAQVVFAPERFKSFGVVVSGISLILLLGYLFYRLYLAGRLK